jgi:hypothetical protein
MIFIWPNPTPQYSSFFSSNLLAKKKASDVLPFPELSRPEKIFASLKTKKLFWKKK